MLNGIVNLGLATALMERCFLFIGNDSAPLHMAAAVGTPTLGIFGPTNPINYRPVGRHVAIVRSGIACSPCFSFVGSTTLYGGSKCQDNQCLKVLAPHRVVAAAESLLRRVGKERPVEEKTQLSAQGALSADHMGWQQLTVPGLLPELGGAWKDTLYRVE